MKFTDKQAEVWRNTVLDRHRWNVSTGATRAGKTYLDYYKIPRRITQFRNESGLVVLLGNTKGTLERNILDPMRDIWGPELVGNISSANKVTLFGQECYALGADKVSSVHRIQGAGIKYCYGDEVTTWNEEVFQMLKSRLDKPNSTFDGTCNPDHPKHWFKEFLDGNSDIYHQHYTIDDNPYLSPEFVSALKQEYEGTIYYDRFIRGLWIRAEGIIYRKFSADSKSFITDQIENFMQINIGVDFGGNKSGHAFVATGIERGYKGITVLASERHFGEIDPDKLGELFCDFVLKIITLYGRADYAYCDSAEQVLIRGLKTHVDKRMLPITLRNAVKGPINDRIRTTVSLMSQGRFRITNDCESLREALCDAVWDESKLVDVRLDDGTTDIDSLDAFEYTFERETKFIIDYRRFV